MGSKIIAVTYATFAVAKKKPEKKKFITSSSSSFHGFITNQFNDLLPVGLLA